MKFRIVNYNGRVDLICANGEFKSGLTALEVISYLAHFDVSFPGTNPQDEEDTKNYNGKTLLQLRDDNVLEINDLEYFREIITPMKFPYYTIKEFCADEKKSNGRGRAIVTRMCQEGRIEGAVFSGDVWYIPKTSKYPNRKERNKKNESNT